MLLLKSLPAVIALAACVNAVAITNGHEVPRADDSTVIIPTIDPSVDPLTALQQLQEATLHNIEHQDNLRKRVAALPPPVPPRSGPGPGQPGTGPAPQPRCTLANARVRRDWEHLTKPERKEYIRAVQCLRALPAKSSPDFSAAARTRYDDFVALHVNKTLYIHGNGLFLTWHRYFVWAYEEALRNECGYKGYQPYWNWFRHTENEHANPVFDGSDTSMGGDGEFVAHNGSLAGARLISLPSGQGGGCIKSGPFKNAMANIGPFNPGMAGLGPVVATLHDYNPHCITRDLSSYAASKWYTTENLLNVTIGTASRTHRSYWQEISGRYPDQFLGFHTTGHYVINGENTDLYSSPNDPAFFLHHAQFDRLYWIHQTLHPSEARKVTGTLTLQDRPPTRNATVDDILEMGFVGKDRPIREVFDTLGGSPLCYIYL